MAAMIEFVIPFCLPGERDPAPTGFLLIDEGETQAYIYTYSFSPQWKRQQNSVNDVSQGLY